MGVILVLAFWLQLSGKATNVRQMLAAISPQLGETRNCSLGIDIVGTAHGAARADTLESNAGREGFI